MRSSSAMSSRRGTNNSTVSSLEEQSAVISGTLEKGGLDSTVLDTTSIEKVKNSKKKSSKSKGQTTFSKSPGHLDAGNVTNLSSKTSSRDEAVSRPERSLPGNSRSNRVGHAPLGAVGLLEAREPLADTEPVLIDGASGQSEEPLIWASLGTAGIGPGPSGDSDSAHSRDAGSLSDEARLEQLQRQQQWMWQSQFQPFGYNPFGNMMPNFAFPNPLWGIQDPAEIPNPGGPSAAAAAAARPVHAMSEDEEDEDEIMLVADGGEDPDPPPAAGAHGPLPPAPAVVTRAAEEARPVGSLAELVDDQMAQIKEADKVSAKVDPKAAILLERYLEDAHLVSEMERLAKAYPRVENVEAMKVPRLDAEVFQAVEPPAKATDQGFQAIQKAVLGAMSAFAPIYNLAFKRLDKDKELNSLGQNFLDGFHLLALVHNNLSARRREALRPHISPVYAKTLTRGHSASPDWLYGGDLSETTKTCEAVKRMGEKIVKRKQQFRGRSGPPQKKFRAQHGNFTQGFFRPNPFQMQHIRFPAPQMVPAQQMQYPAANQNYGFNNYGYNNFQHQRRFRSQGPRQKQGFAKRGGYSK